MSFCNCAEAEEPCAPWEEPRANQIAKILGKLDLIDQSLIWWALCADSPEWTETPQFQAYKGSVVKQHPEPNAVFEELSRRYHSNLEVVMSGENQRKLQALAHKMMGFGAQIFDESGPDELVPLWHGEDADGKAVIICTPYEPGSKDEVAEVLREKFHESRVIRCGHLTEGWMRIAKPEEGAFTGNVSQHPDRQEIMLVTAEDKYGNSVMLTRPILRLADGKPKLGALEEHTSFAPANALRIEGRFTHLLAD